MQDEDNDTEGVADINASEKKHNGKSAEEDPPSDDMEDEKIGVVSVKLQEIKYVQDDVVSIAQVKKIKRCMLKKMRVYNC